VIFRGRLPSATFIVSERTGLRDEKDVFIYSGTAFQEL
jgi:hypothetical protein